MRASIKGSLLPYTHMAIWWSLAQPAANSCRPDHHLPSQPPAQVLSELTTQHLIPLVFTECKRGWESQSRANTVGWMGHTGVPIHTSQNFCVCPLFQLAPWSSRGLSLWLPPASPPPLPSWSLLIGRIYWLHPTQRGALTEVRKSSELASYEKCFSTSEPAMLNLTALQDAHLG